ncbi:MAG: YlmC/YmxH family sporulation protein [Clostridia bacterium]|nr:YlmC/YmxH family sporulation protein [Clostridia bacterium]
MELTFSELRAKEVVNTQDGRKLGKVCDIALCYPENRWIGIVVPNGGSFSFKKNGLFIELKHIVKIGEDVILVNVGLPRNQGKKGGMHTQQPAMEPPQRRSYEEYE